MVPASGPWKIVIADDHALVRSGLKDIISRIDGAEIAGEAADGFEAIALGRQIRPDLMTLDAGMPRSRGMEVYGEVRRWSPDTRIAVVTGFTSARTLSEWIDAGVDGLFLKSCDPDVMHRGLEAILRGGRFIARDVAGILEGEAEIQVLTARERQVLHLIAQGCSNAAIAERLSISAKTVDNHRTRLMAKLGVHSVAELLAFALREGLLDQSAQL
ncbi:LuxR C-terminal-related transcriptional regulator [Antarctobacter heliothermus]|uniref:LuxR C-terminal-related transcriptional regulator n=1 Tax=Antarctobacter heliothermus TaxID=74033 RepID=UPI000A27196C|nr:response regulator transcription factor [Antarctobacter heliothermus]